MSAAETALQRMPPLPPTIAPAPPPGDDGERRIRLLWNLIMVLYGTLVVHLLCGGLR